MPGYNSSDYSTAVGAVKMVLARAGIEPRTSEFGTTMSRALESAPAQVRADVDRVVLAMTGGTVLDLAATRQERRVDTSFVRVSASDLISRLKAELGQAIAAAAPKRVADRQFRQQLESSLTTTLINRESGGRLNVSWTNAKTGGATDSKGRVMTASGPFQYIMRTWNAYAKLYRSSAIVYSDALKYRADTYKMVAGSPGDIVAACQIHALGLVESASALVKARLPINDQTMYLCHLAGNEAAVEMLTKKNVDTSALRLDVNPTAIAFAKAAIATV